MGLVTLLVLLLFLASPSVRTVEANVGCPGSTSNLGNITLSGNCTIDTDTSWANGAVTIAGDLSVDTGALTLNNVYIYFEPSFDDEFALTITNDFTMNGGGISTTNAYQFRLRTASNPTIVIDGAEFAKGDYDFSKSEHDIGYSTFRDSNNGPEQHLWLGPNSAFHHNTLLNVTVFSQAAMVLYQNYGNTKIWGNELHLHCAVDGFNCMGIEIINMHDGLTSLYPGFPVVEVAWNNVTWESIGSNTNLASYDNEYSMRIYEHNNTQQIVAGATEAATECLEMGGPLDSIFEYNRCYGRSGWGYYHYIYSDGGNIVQNNYFEDVEYMGITQSGNNIYRHNYYANVVKAGPWICPSNAGCAGSSSTVAGNVWYNNTLKFAPSPYGIIRASTSNLLDNTMLTYGGSVDVWTEGGASAPKHRVPGEAPWLYYANQDIQALQFANGSDGTRSVSMTAGGQTYTAVAAGFGATDTTTLTLQGPIDRRGSSNYDDSGGGTFLSTLGRPRTEIDVLAAGDVTFTVDAFYADAQYNVSMDGSPTSTFTTDSTGRGTFTLTLASQHTIVITGEGDDPPPPPPDVTAPAPVADLEAVVVNSDWTILQWRAPGDDGSSGQASAYDLRYNTTGPLDDANFDSGIPVTTATPAFAGVTERLNVSGLSPNTTYWFALRAADEVPNWSPLSNVVNATTLGTGEEPAADSTPPQVSLLTPLQGATVSGVVEVTVEATDDMAVAGVTLLVDDSQLGRLTEAPYVWAWATAGLPEGIYVLTAEATDPAGNRGSDQVSVLVQSGTGEDPSIRPRVNEARYDVATATVAITFSKPMNRTSVEGALALEPVLSFTPQWSDDQRLTLMLQPPLEVGIYVLLIDTTAVDLEGNALDERFTYGFESTGTGNPGGAPDLWLQAMGVLAAGWVIVLVLLLRSRKGMRDLRASVRELAYRLQEQGGPGTEGKPLDLPRYRGDTPLDVPRY